MSSFVVDIIKKNNIKSCVLTKNEQFEFMKNYIVFVLDTNPTFEYFIYTKLNNENLLVHPIIFDEYGFVVEGPTLLTDIENTLLEIKNTSLLNSNSLYLTIFIILALVIIYINYITFKKNDFQSKRSFKSTTS